jgi:monomeric sarcosine oxidase
MRGALSEHADVVVVGGGVVGLATAWQLARRDPALRIVLLERHALSHAHGASHGAHRITRTPYPDPLWVRLMAEVNAVDWPALEEEARATLVHRRDVVFFGPPEGPFADYVRAVEGADVERVSAAEAARRFPSFRFTGGVEALHDRTGGVIAAADTLAALASCARARGVRVVDGVRVTAVSTGRVETEHGTVRADRIIVTAGAWIGPLLRVACPDVDAVLSPARQSVGYFDVDGDPRAVPPWAYVGTDRFFYGLPAFGASGPAAFSLKAALHATAGRRDDPEREVVDDVAIAAVRDFLDTELAAGPVRALRAAETCIYTNTPDEGFVLERVGEGIFVGAACSGHAFKLAPIVGRVLADLAVGAAPSVEAYAAAPGMFGLGRFRA